MVCGFEGLGLGFRVSGEAPCCCSSFLLRNLVCSYHSKENRTRAFFFAETKFLRRLRARLRLRNEDRDCRSLASTSWFEAYGFTIGVLRILREH